MSLDINLPVPTMALLIEYTVGEVGSRETPLGTPVTVLCDYPEDTPSRHRYDGPFIEAILDNVPLLRLDLPDLEPLHVQRDNVWVFRCREEEIEKGVPNLHLLLMYEDKARRRTPITVKTRPVLRYKEHIFGELTPLTYDMTKEDVWNEEL
ncbi:hypothetical protein Goe7_c01940 [Bacillus phage vB_BveM-Goe7]|nr:hypothetical protein Goe7_c01940 [Bacillus phage vB_BveM-Goe7]